MKWALGSVLTFEYDEYNGVYSTLHFSSGKPVICLKVEQFNLLKAEKLTCAL